MTYATAALGLSLILIPLLKFFIPETIIHPVHYVFDLCAGIHIVIGVIRETRLHRKKLSGKNDGDD